MPSLSTVIICIIIFVFCVLAVISYVKKLSGGCCGAGGGEIKIKPEDKNKNHYKYKTIVNIENMTCSHCVRRVENAFNKNDGCYARVSLKNKCAEVLSKTELCEKDIKAVVERAGYEYKGMTKKEM